MLDDLIFTILMLILPAILWIVPKTRRNNGNWLIAWKTVPLGFIAICWTGWLMSKIQSVLCVRLERNIDIPFWVAFAVALTVAFLVIIPGGLFIRRKFGAEKKYNPGPSILIFLAAVPHVIILSWILSFVSDLGADDYTGEEIPSCFFHDIDCEKPTPGWYYSDFAALVEKAKAEGKL